MPTAKAQSAPATTQYRFIGDHATVLESGQPLGPGEYVDLGPDDMVGVNSMLLADGKLIDATGYTPESPVEAQSTEATTTTEETPA